MKKLLLSLSFLLFAVIAFAQTISGTITDETGEPLIGATVTIEGTTIGASTDFDGNFSLSGVPSGEQNLVVSYLGFTTLKKGLSISGDANLGMIKLQEDAVGLKEVSVIASIAVDRKTPVAVSTIKGSEIEAIVGNNEFPEVLKSTPSVYATKSGGGFGDSRINVRGFDQRNTAVMINGIPVNDMENGWVYWSNWAGLSDVTSQMQVQRGLGASKIAVPSVGGSINIITNAADFEKGGKAKVSIGNDAYQKYAVALSSGLNDKGFAATLQLTHTRGDGYIDGTMFRAYSYFLSLSQRLSSNQTISLSAVGAPQWHHQRTTSNFDRVYLQTYKDLGIKFNHVWGMLDGEEFSWRKNFYHKPKVFVNHYWDIDEKTDIKTSAYISFGRGGGTGPRGRLRTPGSVFDSFSGLGRNTHDENGQVRFDDIVRYNQGQTVDGWGDPKEQFNGQNIVTSDGRFYFADGSRSNAGSGFVRRASMNSHNWFGVLSTLTSKLDDNFTFSGGIDARYYKGEHYRRLENLLGADGFMSRSDDNNPMNLITDVKAVEFGSFGDNTHNPGENVLAYHNDGLVGWIGLFSQLEYSKDNLSAFVSLSGSNQAFKRIDYFNYKEGHPNRETDWESFFGGTVKAGANYNIDDNHNVFLNAGYLSKQPIFDNVFLNFRNDVNQDAENQDIYAIELGYGYRSNNLRANVNLYSTIWDNRQFDESFTALALGVAGDTVEVSANATYFGVKEQHSGIELEVDYRPIQSLTLKGMASIGNWIYKDNFTANLANTDTSDPLLSGQEETIFADGLKVGDAAQTTFSLGAKYEIIEGLFVNADYYFADNLYAEFNILEDQFKAEGGQVVKLPSYSLVDAGISYRHTFSDKLAATVRFNMNNVLDTEYVAELDTNVVDDPDTADENEFYTRNRGFFGFGRTWNASVRIEF